MNSSRRELLGRGFVWTLRWHNWRSARGRIFARRLHGEKRHRRCHDQDSGRAPVSSARCDLHVAAWVSEEATRTIPLHAFCCSWCARRSGHGQHENAPEGSSRPSAQSRTACSAHCMLSSVAYICPHGLGRCRLFLVGMNTLLMHPKLESLRSTAWGYQRRHLSGTFTTPAHTSTGTEVFSWRCACHEPRHAPLRLSRTPCLWRCLNW